ncbi:MAG: hypothetical protein ACRD6I_05875 [Candidatus Acidiferrales bacterium]
MPIAPTVPPPSPPPERSRSLLWWIIGLVVAAVLILGLGTALVAFYFAREVDVIRTGPDGVEIRTPAGTLRAGTSEKPNTGLPEYPNARLSETPGTVELSGPGDEETFLVTAAKYRTNDAPATVDEWYREQLGPSFEREPAGAMVRKRRLFGTEVRSDDLAYIEERDESLRFVVIRRHRTETEIVLARIGKQEVQ